MVSIILLILKIIGIALLCILGVAVLLLLVLLFAPIHYKVEADYHGSINANVRVTWLARIVRFIFKYDDGQLVMYAKILWFTLFNSEDDNSEAKLKSIEHKKAHGGSSSHKDKTVFDEGEDDSLNNEFEQDYYEEPEKISTSEDNSLGQVHATSIDTEDKEITDIKTDELEQSEILELIDTSKQAEAKESFFTRVKNKITAAFTKICSIIKGIIATIKDIINKTENAKESATDKIHQFSEAINDPDNRELVRFLKAQLFKLLKIFKPSKYKVYVHFGFEDPEITGKVAMWLAVLYGFLGMDLSIRPDFEEKVLEGNIYFKGHIQLYGIVFIAIKCLMNKQLRKFIKK